MKSKHTSTAVPDDIQNEQRENIANRKFGTDNLLAGMYKSALADVTGSLKAYAQTFHFHVHSKEVPFAICQNEICIRGRQAIDKAVAIVVGGK